MENLDLLQTHHIEKSKVNVATLNFSGINTNPFEYDDGSPIFTKLNATIASLTTTELPDFKGWSLGKTDKNYI